nr:circadian locomoter output cycles protein kaput-like isoform X1 [Megalopta genalis]
MWMKQPEQVYLPPQHPQQQTMHPGMAGADERSHQHHHHHHTHHHRTAAMDLPVPSNPRAARNMAEKQRRDNHNTNITAMGKLVPAVAESPRKMDKISILRLATAFLRSNYTLGRGTIDFLPRELGCLDLEKYIVDNLIESGGFFIVVTTTGKIVYVSRQVQEHLGHTQGDLLGYSLYDFIHPRDREELTKNLKVEDLQGVAGSSSSSLPQLSNAANENSTSSEDSSTLRHERNPFREQRRIFELRMLHRTASRREHTQYEWFELSGMLKLAESCRNPESQANRARHRDIGSTSNDIIFVGVARLLMKRSITGISIIDANKDEYLTRHLVDGRILYCDHRVSVVAGYLAEEVSGLSAFNFMHKDDLWWAMIALRQMYVRAETCGSSCYRLLSKTGEFIYLRSHGYLELDENTQTVVSFVCINTLVSEEEGMQLVQQMKKRFSATITESTWEMIQNQDDAALDMGSDSQQSSKSSVGDPTVVEDAIAHLVSALSSSVSEIRLSKSPVPDEQYVKAAIVSKNLPPVAAQASKIGIKSIDHRLMVQGTEGRSPKQEPKASNQLIPLNESQDSPRSSGKSMAIKIKEEDTIPEEVTSIIATNDSPVDQCINLPHNPGTSHLDITPRRYIPPVEDIAISDTKSSQYPTKRRHSDENDRITSNKKRAPYFDQKLFVKEDYEDLDSLNDLMGGNYSCYDDDKFPDQDRILKMIFGGDVHSNGTTVPQIPETVLCDNLRRQQHQLTENIALQDSQLNVITQNISNSAKIKSLKSLKAEHNIQKRDLKSLKQDLHNHIAISRSHNNIGV